MQTKAHLWLVGLTCVMVTGFAQAEAWVQTQCERAYADHDTLQVLISCQEASQVTQDPKHFIYGHMWAQTVMDAEPDKLTQAHDLLVHQFDEGDADATVYLAALALDPHNPKPNRDQALVWLEKGVAHKSALAAKVLALDFMSPHPLAVAHPDDKKAFDYMLKAATWQDPQAMYLVGMAYARGKGVTADKAKALTWLMAAAQKDLPDALYMLSLLDSDNPPPQTEAFANQACDLGHLQACVFAQAWPLGK